MNDRGEQPGFVPPNEGGDAIPVSPEQSVAPEVHSESIPVLDSVEPTTTSPSAGTLDERPEIRALAGYKRSDLQAALEDAEHRMSIHQGAEREEAERDLSAAQELIQRLDVATTKKNATPKPSGVDASVITKLEETLAAQRTAQAEARQRMEEHTGPVRSTGMAGEAPGEAGTPEGFVVQSAPVEAEPGISVEVNPETGPLAEARKLDDARERYASTLRSQKKWLGAASPAEIDAARANYIEQASTALHTAVTGVREKYAGQDLQNPEVQAAFNGELLSVTMKHRMAEEQVLREAMRDGQHRRLLDGVRTYWKKHSKARMVISGTLTGVGLATRGTPVSALAFGLRGLLTGVTMGSTIDAAAQTIRKDFGDTRSLKPEYITELGQRMSAEDPKEQGTAKAELERLIAAHTMQQVDDGAKEFGVQDRGILKWKRKDDTGKQLLDVYDESIRTQQEQEIAFHIKNGKSVEEIIALHIGAVGGEREVLHDAYIHRIKTNKKWNAIISATSVIGGAVVASFGFSGAMKAGAHATGMMQGAHDTKDQSAEALQKALAASANGHPPTPPSSIPFGTATPDAMGMHTAPLDTAQVAHQPLEVNDHPFGNATPDAMGMHSTPMDTLHTTGQQVVEQGSNQPFGTATPDAMGFHDAPVDTSHQTLAEASRHTFGATASDTLDAHATHLGPESAPSDALHVTQPAVPKVGSESLHFLGDAAPHASDNSPEGLRAALESAAHGNTANPDFHNPFTSVGHSEIEHAKTVAALAGTATEHSEVAQAGDSVWSLTEKFVSHQFPNLSAEQRTWMIDSIKDKIVAHPELAGLHDANHLEVGAKVDFDKLGIDFSSIAGKATHLSPEVTRGIHEHLATHADTVAQTTVDQAPAAASEVVHDVPRMLRDTPIMFQDAHGKLVEMGSHLSATPEVITAVGGEAHEAMSQYDAAFNIWALDVKPDALRTALSSLRSLTISDAMAPGKIESLLATAKADDPMFEQRLGELLRGAIAKMPELQPQDTVGKVLETFAQAKK